MAALEEFIAIHGPQLKALNFPRHLVSDLFKVVCQNENRAALEEDFCFEKSSNSRSLLQTKKALTKNGSFYLVDHLWSSDGNAQVYEMLKKSPLLAEKLAGIFSVPPKLDVQLVCSSSEQSKALSDACKCTADAAQNALNAVNYDTVTAAMTLLDERKPSNEEQLNKGEQADEKCSFEEFVAALESTGNLPEQPNEAYLRKMYENFLNADDGSGTTAMYNWTDEGDIIIVYVPIPPTTNKHSIISNLTTRNWNLKVFGKEIVNGNLHASVKSEDSYWTIESAGLLCMTMEKVSINTTWPVLVQGEEKLSSSEILENAWVKNMTEKIYYEDILNAMWKFNQTYSVASPDGTQKQPVWYVMDKYGSAVIHSDDPNFKCSPFFSVSEGKVYSLMWPIKNIPANTICTRNFIPQIIANETLDMCKVRLKAFHGKKIYKYIESLDETEDAILNMPKVESIALKDLVENELQSIMVYSSGFTNSTCDIKDKLLNLKISLTQDNNVGVDYRIIPLNDVLIQIDSDKLPASEMTANKDYLKNYLKYCIGDIDWYSDSYILPSNLVEFNKKYEQTDLPQYWIIKSVDKRLLDFPAVVTSDFSRIVRLCEPGSIAVSKYLVDQPTFRDKKFTLSYPVVISYEKNIYIHKQPCIRQSVNKINLNEIIEEYSQGITVTKRPERENMNQSKDFYDDFKVQMNRLLLPKNPDKGWKATEEIIFERIGYLAVKFSEDIFFDLQRSKDFVVLSVDVIFDDDVNPIVIDVDGKGILPNSKALVNIFKLTQGHESKSFVKVLQ